MKERMLKRVAAGLDKRIAALPPSQKAYIEKIINQTKEHLNTSESKEDTDKNGS